MVRRRSWWERRSTLDQFLIILYCCVVIPSIIIASYSNYLSLEQDFNQAMHQLAPHFCAEQSYEVVVDEWHCYYVRLDCDDEGGAQEIYGSKEECDKLYIQGNIYKEKENCNHWRWHSEFSSTYKTTKSHNFTTGIFLEDERVVECYGDLKVEKVDNYYGKKGGCVITKYGNCCYEVNTKNERFCLKENAGHSQTFTLEEILG